MARYTGANFGSYEILDLIAHGGMGEVYRARHRRLQGREAAVKIMPAPLAADPSFLQRFEREANSVASLNHPHILPIWDYGEQDGAPYIVMPLVTGGSLRDHLHGHPVAPAALLRIITPIASALDYAHQRGIVHRDIKPANVLLDTNGHLYLADFGIAKALGPNAENLTQTGVGIGTPEYMAPEQTEGRADQRSDIYALGVIAYEGLTGRVPYSGHTPIDVAIKHMTAPLPPMASPAGAINPLVEQTVRRALEKSPGARYTSAGAFAADLAEGLRQIEASRPTSPVAADPTRAFDSAPSLEHPTVVPPAQSNFTPLPVPTNPPIQAAPPPPSPPPATANRRPIILALIGGLAIGLVLTVGVGALLLSRGPGVLQGKPSPTSLPRTTPTPRGDIPFNFPVTNADVISNYGRAQQLLQSEASDTRLRWATVECYDPRANADCRLSYGLYSEQKQMLYEVGFSYYAVEPPEIQRIPVDDDSQRVIFIQLPWERNANWARLLGESYNQLPSNYAPSGFSAYLSSDANEANRGDRDWAIRYTDKDTSATVDFKQRGQIVTKDD